MHKHADAYYCLMEHTPERMHATIIFTSFEVKFSKETILKVSILDHLFIKEKLLHVIGATSTVCAHLL